MKAFQIRQGDVLLIPVEIPAPPGAQATSELVLAYGEVTGHTHRLLAPAILQWEQDRQRYVQVRGSTPGTLVHEDHDPIPAPVVIPGQTYRVMPQREWDISGLWRRVQD